MINFNDLKDFITFNKSVCMCMWVPQHTCRSEDNFLEAVFSFHNMDSGAQTQVLRVGGRHPYLLKHLASSRQSFCIMSI